MALPETIILTTYLKEKQATSKPKQSVLYHTVSQNGWQQGRQNQPLHISLDLWELLCRVRWPSSCRIPAGEV